MNRLVMPLLMLTVIMQGALLYKQYFHSAQPAASDGVRNAPSNAVLDLADTPTKGNKEAKVVLVEFSDYECPFCQRHANTVGKQLDETFVSTGKVRYVFVNNPLSIHSNAKLLATAAICAGKQDYYWQMHDDLFATKPKAKPEIMEIAQMLGLNADVFSECLDASSDAERTIARDIKVSQDFSLTGTPAFAVGQLGSDGRVHVEKFIVGAMPFDIFEKALNKVLTESPRRPNG
jgi:protein-disulfide isomerase